MRMLHVGLPFSVVCAITISVTLVPAAAGAQDSAVRRSTQRAASCFERFAEGQTLPAVPEPAGATSAPSNLLQALMHQHPRDPAAMEARARLRHCLPAELSFDTQLTRSQARWLGRCFSSAGSHPDVVACMAVGRMMATYDPDVSEMFARSGTEQPTPGVTLTPEAHPSRVTGSDRVMVGVLARTSVALAACRASHGHGQVRVFAAHENGSWTIRAWPLEGSEALAECVARNLSSTAAPSEGPGQVVALVVLRAPRSAPASRGTGLNLNRGIGLH